MPRCVLYQIANRHNGKYYIGAHVCSDEHRCFANGMCTYMGSGTAIKRAVNKHGVATFQKDILAEVESEEFLYRLEAAVVNEAFVKRNDTYNMTVGGNRPPSGKGVKRSPEHCKRIGEAARDRWKNGAYDTERFRSRDINHAGINNPFYGKRHSVAARQRIAASRVGKTSGKKGIPNPALAERNRLRAARLREERNA